MEWSAGLLARMAPWDGHGVALQALCNTHVLKTPPVLIVRLAFVENEYNPFPSFALGFPATVEA